MSTSSDIIKSLNILTFKILKSKSYRNGFLSEKNSTETI